MGNQENLLLLDTGVLGQITYIRHYPEAQKCLDFIKVIKYQMLVPEICDYELRRELIRNDNQKAINKLNELRRKDKILLLNSEDIIEAAEIWAWARNNGKPTADDKALDVDVIVIAQAIHQSREFKEVIIVTTDPDDFYRFKDRYSSFKIWDWKQAVLDCIYQEINFYRI